MTAETTKNLFQFFYNFRFDRLIVSGTEGVSADQRRRNLEQVPVMLDGYGPTASSRGAEERKARCYNRLAVATLC